MFGLIVCGSKGQVLTLELLVVEVFMFVNVAWFDDVDADEMEPNLEEGKARPSYI